RYPTAGSAGLPNPVTIGEIEYGKVPTGSARHSAAGSAGFPKPVVASGSEFWNLVAVCETDDADT
ncbi:hypothetical protein pipiens_020209, partial [Culex pipiens pipiens]